LWPIVKGTPSSTEEVTLTDAAPLALMKMKLRAVPQLHPQSEERQQAMVRPQRSATEKCQRKWAARPLTIAASKRQKANWK